jgi:hypothetical protein
MNCIRGLASKLNESPRFNAVVIEGLDLRGTGIRKFPPPLSWDEVQEYCNRFKVDGLIVLEVFDSNIEFEQSDREVEKEIDKKKVKVREYTAEIEIDVSAGWKGYDPVKSHIFDQDIYMDGKSWSHTDNSREKALQGLPDKRAAINESAYHAGYQYALRISPSWMNATRRYYKSGNSQMEIAHRCVKTNDWEEAESLWIKSVEDPDPRIAGRASYNLILAREIDGDLPAAAQWARISYQDYDNKKALKYLEIIEQRMKDQQKLKEQME